jgi:pentapeptide MXKDX repeat protein
MLARLLADFRCDEGEPAVRARKEPYIAAAHTYGKDSSEKRPRSMFLNPISVLKASGKKFSGYWVIPRTVATLCPERHMSLQNGSKGRPTMTISTRVALGISAAALSLSLALAPVAFAQDKMSKDDGMKKDAMSKDDGMKKDAMKKDDAMSKDAMKKDDGTKKDETKK